MRNDNLRVHAEKNPPTLEKGAPSCTCGPVFIHEFKSLEGNVHTTI